MSELAHFGTFYLDRDAEDIRNKFRTSLPVNHPARREQALRHAEDSPTVPPRPVLTFGAVAREFVAAVSRCNTSIERDQVGSAPTYPFGRLGISADGVLLSIARLTTGQINVLAGHLDTDGLMTGSWHGVQDNDGSITLETNTRFRAYSRAVGEATLRPTVPDIDGFESVLELLYVTREVDISASEYEGMHADAQVPPIGSLNGVGSHYPIFPLDALLRP